MHHMLVPTFRNTAEIGINLENYIINLEVAVELRVGGSLTYDLSV